MEVLVNIPDSLLSRLTANDQMAEAEIVRLLVSALDLRDSANPLNNAYRTLFEQTHDAVFIIAPTGDNIAVNGRAVELTGYSVDELLSISFRQLSAERIESSVTLNNLLSGHRVAPYERTFRMKSGKLFTAEVTAELVRDSNGEPLYIQSVVRDITQRKYDELRLRASERLLRQIIDLVPLHIYAKDRQGRFILANRAVADAYGTTIEHLIGKSDADFAYSGDEVKAFLEQDRQVIKSGQPLVIPEVTLTDVHGRTRTYRTIKMPLIFPDSTEPSVLGVSSDITDMKEAAQELRQAYRQAYDFAAERQRVHILTQFMQDTSHEFRTPLAILSTSLYLITRAADTEKRAAHAAHAAAQIEQITRLLDHLQTMADLDSDIEFSFAPVNINHILLGIAELLTGSQAEHRLLVNLELDECVPLYSADPIRLSQAFEHILDNAVRFTPAAGSVTVKTRLEPDYIVVEISDTGVGIPADALPNVMLRFWRMDESHTTPGFGLGLPIAQKIIERHNGTLALASPDSTGTIVTITLPLPNEGISNAPDQ